MSIICKLFIKSNHNFFCFLYLKGRHVLLWQVMPRSVSIKKFVYHSFELRHRKNANLLQSTPGLLSSEGMLSSSRSSRFKPSKDLTRSTAVFVIWFFALFLAFSSHPGATKVKRLPKASGGLLWSPFLSSPYLPLIPVFFLSFWTCQTSDTGGAPRVNIEK